MYVCNFLFIKVYIFVDLYTFWKKERGWSDPCEILYHFLNFKRSLENMLGKVKAHELRTELRSLFCLGSIQAQFISRLPPDC